MSEETPAGRYEFPVDNESLEFEVDKLFERNDARVFEIMEKFRELVISTDLEPPL